MHDRLTAPYSLTGDEAFAREGWSWRFPADTSAATIVVKDCYQCQNPLSRVASKVTVTEGHTLRQKALLPKTRGSGDDPRCPTGPQGQRRDEP